MLRVKHGTNLSILRPIESIFSTMDNWVEHGTNRVNFVTDRVQLGTN